MQQVCFSHHDYPFKKFTDERSNQLLVLKMQRQSWRSSTLEERMANRQHHRSILQEAVGIVFENKRLELRGSQVTVDESVVSAAILSDLQEEQDAESQLLLSLVHKVLYWKVLEFRRILMYYISALRQSLVLQ